MVDRDRVLAKLDELDGYLRELRSIACERLAQVAVEATLDVQRAAPVARERGRGELPRKESPCWNA